MRKIYLGWGLIIVFILTIAIIKIFGLDSTESDEPVLLKVMLTTGALGMLIFWIWMLSDFFKRTDIKHKVAWGWMLIIANWLAAIIYFLLVYSPKKRGEQIKDK